MFLEGSSYSSRVFFDRDPAWVKRFKYEVKLIHEQGGRIIKAVECNDGYAMVFEVKGKRYYQRCWSRGIIVSCYTGYVEGRKYGSLC
ncbi:hypothetical protein [Alphaspiravirus yamagawaense]|uniref:Uncharacterized protein n=1 Tax=Alphaspiravirus yamagawaense TaxID=1157339 RepID=J7Q214_9VIRU|nr:hypothetical protein [Aeropyrum coil-shaped virus]CCG27860.1 hypothetical protein [Aeropyrum coil-shaped virus]